MSKFMKTHKKEIKIGIIVFVCLMIFLMVWLFIIPSFNGNKYGDRLKDDHKHKISSDVVTKIKDMAKDNDSVEKVDYHKEGRILNFTITVDSNLGVNQAKEFVDSIVKEIDEDDQKYYDMQFFIDSNDKSDSYPIIAYKSKNSDNINYGNVGGGSE